MGIARSIASFVLIALHGTATAAPERACAEVSARVEEAVRPVLASRSEHHPDAAPADAAPADAAPADATPAGATPAGAAPVGAAPADAAPADAAPANTKLRDCLSSRNICVLYSARHGKEALVAADVTTDLPAQGLGQGESSVVVLVRSIPRVRNDSNRYCLVSEKQTGAAASGHQWAVYGWVIPPNATESLPLPRQILDENTESDPHSLRGLAAALWFFAEGMSGHPPRQQNAAEEAAR